ncbi:MAG: site-specific DNA-methyltransferase [Anaerolineales bacterium]|nr:site-specific DNA-methyltransferase [Anaerolineales bacterium]
MTPSPITQNTLFYGDNLPILREYIADESIDLIYLDPPFNSQRTYNVLFRDESGQQAESQLAAFDDTWHWGPSAEETYHELVTQAPDRVSKMVAALREFVGSNQMMAYLVMMAARLLELHRVLKPTGSLYLHCDPTASHYLKVVMDVIFGPQNYRNEITWKRTFAHGNVGRNYGSIADVIFWYSKAEQYTWNQQFSTLTDEEIVKKYPHEDPDGRRWQSVTLRNPGPRPNLHFPFTASNGVTYQPHPNGWGCNLERLQKYDRENRLHFPSKASGALRLKMYADESPGERLQNIWDDIPPIGAQAAERLGYPTQKPVALLERIIAASSNPGDLVLDPFCGCGTSIAAAQQLGRRWVGIDITHLSIALMKYRLEDAFGLKAGQDYQIIGEPTSLSGARQLALDNRFQFQWWALSLVRARPLGAQPGSKQGKRGADQGIDGVITFVDEARGAPKRVIVQVKSGHVGRPDVGQLVGTIEREKAAIGVLVTLEPPTGPMELEALSAGYYHSPGWNRDYPRIQILTVEQLLDGAQVEMPPQWGTFKQAEAAERRAGEQGRLEL